MAFTVTLYQDEDGKWVVACPSIPGCVSQGETREEALESIKDAIEGCLLVRAERGMPLVIEIDEIDDLDHEIVLIRQNPELMAFLDERFKPEKSYSEEQVREMLGLD
jgi:predicted RNase H-like HicB family nuclease